ncbi:MAG: hypothetical protein M1383_05130 [Patescibacteria group bacterium]|nr:hypothetical protein [Patescibacteria group bacterium]
MNKRNLIYLKAKKIQVLILCVTVAAGFSPHAWAENAASPSGESQISETITQQIMQDSGTNTETGGLVGERDELPEKTSGSAPENTDAAIFLQEPTTSPVSIINDSASSSPASISNSLSQEQEDAALTGGLTGSFLANQEDSAAAGTSTLAQGFLTGPSEADPAATSTATGTIDIINNNEGIIENQVEDGANTGENFIESGGDLEDSAINTGDVNVYANVLNVINTNLYNSQITELVQNFDSLSADLYLNNPQATPAELAQDLVTKICTDAECKSLSSFTLTNQNLAAVRNNVAMEGNSGGNSLTAQNDVKDSSISTGNVNAVVNILNIVNTNLVDSRWTFASINIFGSWTGDLVLPPELYFAGYMSVGAPDNQALDLEQVKKVVLSAQNSNDALVINDINTQADTGNNGLDALETEEGEGGDVHDIEVQTGKAEAVSNVETQANANIVNTRWYLNLVNTLGNWEGGVYSLPDQVVMSPTIGGLSFFSTSDNNNEAAYRAFAQAIADLTEEASTTASSTFETAVSINNDNTAAIANDVDVIASTGANNIAGSDVKRSKIITGNAKALANIINFANTNLIGSDLQIGLVNIFGDWDGNIVFGFPDLAVTQQLLSPAYPKEKGRDVNFQLGYSNLSQSSMSGTVVEWQYDPEILEVAAGTLPAGFSQPKPGFINFDLGKLSPGISGQFTIPLKTAAILQAGDQVQTFARIWGLGPELDMDNNQSFLESIATTTVFSQDQEGQGSSDNNNDNNNNNSNGNGGASGGSSGGGGGGGGSGYFPQADLFRIYKNNSLQGASAKAGDSISFHLIVDNDGTNDLFNVVVYDTLYGPGNSVLLSKQFSLGTILSRQEIAMDYDLNLPTSITGGTYTNSAYAEGLNAGLQQVKSEATALSSFIVGNAASGNLPGAEGNSEPDREGNGSPDGANGLAQVLGESTAKAHPGGTLILDGKTVYLISQNQRRGFRNEAEYKSYGFNFSLAVPANEADRLLPLGPVLKAMDGTLALDASDNRTIYIIGSGGVKRGFVSEKVFKGLGYSFKQAVKINLGDYPAGSPIDTFSGPHPNGTLVLSGKTVWWVNNGKKFGFPSMDIFKSYGWSQAKIVPASAADLDLPAGNVLKARMEALAQGIWLL